MDKAAVQILYAQYHHAAVAAVNKDVKSLELRPAYCVEITFTVLAQAHTGPVTRAYKLPSEYQHLITNQKIFRSRASTPQPHKKITNTRAANEYE